MLLKEVTAPTSTDLIKQVNRYLRECHGCVINVSTPTGVLRQLQSTLTEDIRQQRINGATPEDADYARALLVQRTVQQLIAQRSITESYRSSSNPVFVRLCASLSDSACECVNLGDTVDHAVHKVMDVYRSSRYRFPDSEVEQQVREQINHALGIDPVPVNHTLMDQTVPQDDHWEAEPDTDAPTASELAQALRSQLDAELVSAVPAAELSQHIDSVAQMYAGIPGTKINSALLSDMTDQLRRRISNSGTEPVAAQHASVTVKLLLADEPEEVQEVVDAMLRRLKLVHPEVFDKHTPEHIAAAVADTARFEAPAADLSKRTVDSWLRYVISDLREHTAVSEAAPIVAGAAKAFASGAGAAVANRVMDHISETALGEHPVIQRLLKVYGPNPVSAAISDLGDQQQHMSVDELAQEISRRIVSGDYDAELPFAVRTQKPLWKNPLRVAFMMARQSAVDAGKDHFDFEGRTYPVTGDADLSEKSYAKKRKKSSEMSESHDPSTDEMMDRFRRKHKAEVAAILAGESHYDFEGHQQWTDERIPKARARKMLDQHQHPVIKDLVKKHGRAAALQATEDLPEIVRIEYPIDGKSYDVEPAATIAAKGAMGNTRGQMPYGRDADDWIAGKLKALLDSGQYSDISEKSYAKKRRKS